MSDHLDEEEQLARLKSWWDENGTSILVSVVIAVAGIVGWNWYGGYSDTQRQEQTQLLQEYRAAEVDERATIAQRFNAEFSGSGAHSLVLLDQAKAAVEAGEFTQARAHLQKIVDTGADELAVDLARIRLARVLQQLDLTDEALNQLSAVKNEGYRALALETQGDIHAAGGNIEGAHLAYQAAVESLPEGDTRPILEMKLENAKPYADQYVEMTDQLTEALKEAASTLDVQLPDTDTENSSETLPAVAEEVEAELQPEESNP